MRTIVWEITLRNCSKEAGVQVREYVILVKEYMQSSIYFVVVVVGKVLSLLFISLLLLLFIFFIYFY